MSLKLKEIIWESTLNCDKNCSYCGSKKYLTGEQQHDHILAVAREIARYAPEQLNLSGGEPGMLEERTIAGIFEIFSKTKTAIKVITNGMIFEKGYEKFPWDAIGVSVNTEEDAVHIRQDPRVTVITNFGKHNIWDYQIIHDCIVGNNIRCWQVQSTNGPEQLNAEGILYLREKLKESAVEMTVLADNLQEHHNCSAGINSCGILYNGDVVGCLSERSFCEPVKTYGNVLTEGLQDVWESQFKDRRFGEPNCLSCRKCFHYPDDIQVSNIITPSIKKYTPPTMPTESYDVWVF